MQSPTKFTLSPSLQKSKKIILGFVAFVGIFILYMMFTTYVKPNQIAVRQVYIGPNKGIHAGNYNAGLHLIVPGYERLHTFQKDLQLLEFNDRHTGAGGDGGAHMLPPIRIQTSEGYQVTVDVSVAYRIVDPYKVISTIGPGTLYETTLIGPRSDRILRQKLGQLNAEDFYSGAKRIEAAHIAKEQLQLEVAENGIEIWSVMVRHYTYDDRYQEAIEQRKIQDQMVFKNRAEAAAASQNAEKNRVLAEGQALVDVEKEGGRAEIKRIEADAQLYYREKNANADLLVSLATAEGTKLRNRALQTAGAANMVGLEMAEVLEGSQIIILPTDGESGLNPLDLNELMKGW